MTSNEAGKPPVGIASPFTFGLNTGGTAATSGLPTVGLPQTSQQGSLFGVPTGSTGFRFGAPIAQTQGIMGTPVTASTSTITNQPVTTTSTVGPTLSSGISSATSTNTTVGLGGIGGSAGGTGATAGGLNLPLGGSGPGPVKLAADLPTGTITTNPVTVATTTAPGATGTSTVAPQLTTGGTTSAQTTAGTNVPQMNYRQLQDAINKWMVDLHEQEKVFLEQATKINAWDRTLMRNGEKIAKLNESVSKAKSNNERLENALGHLKTEQRGLEAFLQLMEADLPESIPVGVEPEREQLYGRAANLDTQLEQISTDLKEVIQHINESNKTVDKNDPVSQILRIMNEHTDALQWVEDQANAARGSLADISKQHEFVKKEHERSLRNMFK